MVGIDLKMQENYVLAWLTVLIAVVT